MDKNISTGNCKGLKGEMKDNWAMKEDLTEFDGQLEKMSDMLQEYVDLKYDYEYHYTIFD